MSNLQRVIEDYRKMIKDYFEKCRLDIFQCILHIFLKMFSKLCFSDRCVIQFNFFSCNRIALTSANPLLYIQMLFWGRFKAEHEGEITVNFEKKMGCHNNIGNTIT